MSEKMRESLSALMDGEADELEVQRVLKHAGQMPEMREVWARYHLARDVMSGQDVQHPAMDISQRVSEALTREGTDKGSRIQQLLKPVASFAVAASVAAVVVVGGQQLSQVGDAGVFPSDTAVPQGVSAVGFVNSIGATPVRASYGSQAIPVLQPASRTAYQELARHRMQKYMQEHAEHAALNSPQGLVPFARVHKIQE